MGPINLYPGFLIGIFFLKQPNPSNYFINFQTILLIRQPFKLFSFLTIQDQRTRFCYLKMYLEIECETLNF